MFALLTLPRGVPIDPEALPPPARDAGEAPVGIIIRPGPAPAGVRTPLRVALAAARA
jgi:hypothetical protein